MAGYGRIFAFIRKDGQVVDIASFSDSVFLNLSLPRFSIYRLECVITTVNFSVSEILLKFSCRMFYLKVTLVFLGIFCLPGRDLVAALVRCFYQ